MTNINIERLLRESPIPIDPQSVDEVHRRVFHRPRRRAPDHYDIHEELGRGQFGEVYRATDTRFPREVALKLIRYRGSRQLARLEREAHALAKLAHPNVVVVHEKGIADVGSYYLATELVPGTRLDAWMADPSRRLDEILEVFAQAAEGLHHAHERGLVHRDFKPANAIVDQSGRLRILDFGLAKLMEDEADESREEADATQTGRRPPTATDEAFLVESRTASSGWSRDPSTSDSPKQDLSFLTHGYVIGTPRYASPEQLGGRKVDSRSDQFSLCTALFEACHGFHPFSGRTAIEIAERIESKAVARGQSIRRVPRWLERLLQRGLSPKPEDRFESTRDIAQILREHIKPRSQLWMGLAAGVLLTVGIAGGVGAWHMRVPEGLADLVGPDIVRSKDLARYGTGIQESLVGYAESLEAEVDAYVASWSRDPATEACLVANEQRFEGLLETLSKAPPTIHKEVAPVSMAEERVLLRVLADPHDCSKADPSEPNPELVQALLDAQTKRLVGDYQGALSLLESIAPTSPKGLIGGLLHYELGTVQLQLWNPDAPKTLALAIALSAEDPEMQASMVSRALEAEMTLGTPDGQTVERLLALLDYVGPERASLARALVEANAAFFRGSFVEAQRRFSSARELFAGLEGGAYRDYMMAYCDLNWFYAEGNKENPEIDPVALEGALATVGAVLGDHRPQYLAHGIRVARLLREQEQEGSVARAKALLDRLGETFDPDPKGSSSFDVLWLRAETLIADVALQDYEADEASKTEWLTRSDIIRNALESQIPKLAPGRRRDVFKIREILFITYFSSEAHAPALRALEAMRPMAEALDRSDDTCGYFDDLDATMTEKKIQPTGDLLEIRARFRTLCKR